MKSLAALSIALLVAGIAPLAHSGEMTGMDHSAMSSSNSKPKGVHKAVGVVKKLDPKAGTATLAHEPIKSLNWPAITMSFKVQDKAAFDKLAEGKKVEVEFEQRGKDYVITSVK